MGLFFKSKANVNKDKLVMNHFIESTEVDSSLNLKMSSLFSLMQKAASQHLESLHLGKSATVDIGRNWVITRYDVKIASMPKYLETITIETYFVKASKFIFQRNFKVCNNRGESVIVASSIWCVLEKTNHSIVRNPFQNIKIPVVNDNDEIQPPQKIAASEAKKTMKRSVMYTDLDINGHVGNVRYIDYIIDTHENEFYLKNQISRFEINYEKELMSGEEVTINSDTAEIETITIEINGMTIARARLSFENK